MCILYINLICNIFNVYTYTFLGVEKAHAFAPTHSEIHFNDFEKFAISEKDEGIVSIKSHADCRDEFSPYASMQV